MTPAERAELIELRAELLQCLDACKAVASEGLYQAMHGRKQLVAPRSWGCYALWVLVVGALGLSLLDITIVDTAAGLMHWAFDAEPWIRPNLPITGCSMSW